MDFGISTFFFIKSTARQAIDNILTAGINIIEITCDVPLIDDLRGALLQDLRRLGEQGVRFSLHGPLFEVNLGSVFPELRDLSRKRYEEAIDLAQMIGGDPLVVHPGYSLLYRKAPDLERRGQDNFVEDLIHLVSYAGDRGVRLALENVHVPYFFFHDMEDFHALSSEVPGLGMTLDTGHAYIAKLQNKDADPEGTIVTDIERIGVQHLFHVHLHNNMGTNDDHRFPEGKINLGRILAGLRMLAYSGKVVIESYDVEQGIPEIVEKLDAIQNP
jgi:sugar phosphate isomerase/epimerase